MKPDSRALLTLAIALLSAAGAAAAADREYWIGSWGASPAQQLASPAQMLGSDMLFGNQTVREIVHLSAGGPAIRIRLSNAYGRDPVTVGAVHVALRESKSSLASGTDHAVTFSGQSSVTLPPDGLLLSDPVPLKVPDGADLAISLFLPKPAAAGGIHYSAQQTSYVGNGDQTAAASFAEAATIHSWVFLSGVDVNAGAEDGTVVAFGDSITDGALSSNDSNHRWPNFLAARLSGRTGAAKLGVLDEGIGGNRVLHDPATEVRFGVNALARFDRDVLAQPGVKYVIVLEGINDIGHPGAGAPLNQAVSAEEIIAGLQQLINRAHEKGIKIFGGTLTPFAITTIHDYYSPEKEQKRQAVNQWIRTGHAFDGVIDFDKALEDPANPTHMLPAYDGGDHLHPGDAGYKAMVDAIDLSLF